MHRLSDTSPALGISETFEQQHVDLYMVVLLYASSLYVSYRDMIGVVVPVTGHALQ